MNRMDHLPHVRLTLAAVRAMRAHDAVALRAAVDRMPNQVGLMAAWVAIDRLVSDMARDHGTSWEDEADRVTGMLIPKGHPSI